MVQLAIYPVFQANHGQETAVVQEITVGTERGTLLIDLGQCTRFKPLRAARKPEASDQPVHQLAFRGRDRIEVGKEIAEQSVEFGGVFGGRTEL